MGGIAGLLFGSLLSSLGPLGLILGFMVNMLVIVALILLVVKLFQSVRSNKRKNEEVKILETIKISEQDIINAMCLYIAEKNKFSLKK